jgi:hypothetical protein
LILLERRAKGKPMHHAAHFMPELFSAAVLSQPLPLEMLALLVPTQGQSYTSSDMAFTLCNLGEAYFITIKEPLSKQFVACVEIQKNGQLYWNPEVPVTLRQELTRMAQLGIRKAWVERN